MAYAIKRSNISPSAANSIRSGLCLQPEVQYNKYNRDQTPSPVLFYRMVDDTVHIPFLFAASLFQITPNVDIPFPVSNLTFNGTLRPNQVPIEEEAWSQLEKWGTTTLGLPPGTGKTILGAKLASRPKLLTCVLVHREILTTQWKKTFTDNTNAQVWIVGEKNPTPTCNVIICMDTRWNSIPEAIRNNIGFLIVDEAHCFCTPGRVDCLLAFHPKYILIETATLERDDGMHSMIYAVAGSHGVFRESSKTFNIMKIKTNTKTPRKQNRMGGTDWSALVHDTAFNTRRNQIIVNLVKANLKSKILVLTALKDHATLLHDWLQQLGISCDYLCGTKRGYVDSNVLIGTVSKIGTGFDPATSCPTYAGRPFDLLILACSMKKYSMLEQNIGRVFRAEYPTVMYLLDDDDIFRSHGRKALKWCMSRGGILSEHDIPNVENPTPTSANLTSNQQSWAAEKARKLQLKIVKQE